MNTTPVLLITANPALLDMWRQTTPGLFTLTADTGTHRAALDAWTVAPAVVIGSDAVGSCRHLPPRGGVYVVVLPDAPMPGGVATAPGPIVDMPDGVAWLAGELSNPPADTPPPNGCDECKAAPGESCRTSNCQGTWY